MDLDPFYCINFIITNTGTAAINGWTLSFAFPDSQQKVGQGWNATWTQQGSQVTAKDVGYNSAIAPSGTTSLGFNGTFGSSNPTPTSFTVNGTTCSN